VRSEFKRGTWVFALPQRWPSDGRDNVVFPTVKENTVDIPAFRDRRTDGRPRRVQRRIQWSAIDRFSRRGNTTGQPKQRPISVSRNLAVVVRMLPLKAFVVCEGEG